MELKRSRTVVLILVLSAVIVQGGVVLAAPVTTGTLINEMIDMRRLVEFPDPVYDTVQFSSYDHRSSLPGGPGWFTNSDGFGGEPIPNFEAVLVKPDEKGVGEYLICDVKGPGAIVRVWTASIRGTLRMFLDDAKEPVYDGPAQQFFLNPYKPYIKAAGIEESVFDGPFRQYDASYFPIPFAKRCRIIWTGKTKQIHFYQIQIRRYAPQVQVVTFKPQDFKTYEARIRRVAKILSKPQTMWQYMSSMQPVAIVATVPPKQTQEVLSLDGPKAIERLTLKVSAGDIDRALRQTILRISCDDYPWGQVQSPIGDFFGAAPGINPFDSVAFTVQPDGSMTCRFIMPFAKSLKIYIDNKGSQPVTVSGSVLPMDYNWNDATSMHFRARWRVDHNLVADRDNGVQDMPYLIANGTGLYVGSAVMLLNPNPIPTPWGSWWGEGDEKIFVDDDIVPSTFGTGSEDYFNYSWSVPSIFLYPYCGQPRDDGPANRGFVTNFRWHILDCLPFRQRISFYMELFSHERTPGVSYARIGYHYGRPGLMDDHVLITAEDVRHLELPEWQPAARFGAKNSTFYQAENVVADKADTTIAKDNIWAGGRLLVWHPSNKGDEITFNVPIQQQGRYTLHITAAKTSDSGSFSARLDGKNIGFGGKKGIVDLHVPYRRLSRVVSSGRVELTKGNHELTLSYEGSSQDSGCKTIGIDFIWAQKR